MISLEALSVNKGCLVNLSAAFSYRKDGKSGKQLLPGRFKGFLTGVAAGFAGWAVLCGTGAAKNLVEGLVSIIGADLPEGLVPYLIPILLLIVGIVVNAVGKGTKE